MPTIGELLEQIRNGAMNPEKSGQSPYGGVSAGSHSPIAQPRIDDISDESKGLIGDYLSQRTKGLERLEEQNKYPLEPDIVTTRMTDPTTGGPAPLRTIADGQASFVSETPTSQEELNIRDGYKILEQLGFFEDLDGDDGPLYDKNGQTAGHTLLNTNETRQKVVSILNTTRFSLSNTPDNPFSIKSELSSGPEFLADDGQPKDHPQLEKIKAIAQFVTNAQREASELYPDAKFVANGNTAEIGENGVLEYGERGTTRPFDIPGVPGIPLDVEGIATGQGVAYTPDFPFGSDHNAIGRSLLDTELQAIEAIMSPLTELLNGLMGLLSLAAFIGNRPESPDSLPPGRRFGFGQYTPPIAINFREGTIQPSLSPADLPQNDGLRFFQALGIPIPRFLAMAVGDPGQLATKIVQIAISHIRNTIEKDPSAVGIYKNTIRGLKKTFHPDNNFGLPVIPVIPTGAGLESLLTDNVFKIALSNCGAIKFLRAMAIIAETVSAGSQTAGSTMQPQPWRFSNNTDLNRLKNTAMNRHRAGRLSNEGMSGPLSVRNVPSMYLLPTFFSRGMDIYRRDRPRPIIGLDGNEITNFDYVNLLQTARGTPPAADGGSQGAMETRAGTPLNVSANRFSREEVEAIENMLEAEHTPFYFHDLRTNEVVAFHAFLNALSDSFSPQFSTSGGFGRVEDVQIYQKTTRAIQVDFTLMSMNKADMKEMYWKMNKLIAMVYPQYSRGTMLEHESFDGERSRGITRFVQPFSQITTATPVIRLRVGDLIKSNYSRDAIARKMGVNDPDFRLLEPPIRNVEQQRPLPCEEQIRKVKEFTRAVPLTATGQHDTSRGWPVGSIVILDPPYSPLVDYDPATETASPDRTATIIEGDIGVKILEYIPFTNPLGGSSPNSEEIIIRCELVTTSPVDGFPLRDRIATRNSDGSLITTAMLSYRDINTTASAALICHGVNFDLFPEGLLTDTINVPDEEGTREDEDPVAQAAMHDRLFTEKNPIMRAFETTAGRGLAGVITSLNFDWGINGEINWETKYMGYKAPTGCKISISFTPIHDITPGLDNQGMITAPVFNVAGSSPHGEHEDVHPDGYTRRQRTHEAMQAQTRNPEGGS